MKINNVWMINVPWIKPNTMFTVKVLMLSNNLATNAPHYHEVIYWGATNYFKTN